MHPVEAQIGQHPEQNCRSEGQRNIEQSMLVGQCVNREGNQAGEQ